MMNSGHNLGKIAPLFQSDNTITVKTVIVLIGGEAVYISSNMSCCELIIVTPPTAKS